MENIRRAIAVDFDGCLFTSKFPEIGEPIWETINRAKQEQRNGAGLILWTCREGDLLQAAIKAAADIGLIFDAINESLPEWIEAYGNAPRKIGASEYWDDRAVYMSSDIPRINKMIGMFAHLITRNDERPFNEVWEYYFGDMPVGNMTVDEVTEYLNEKIPTQQENIW